MAAGMTFQWTHVVVIALFIAAFLIRRGGRK